MNGSIQNLHAIVKSIEYSHAQCAIIASMTNHIEMEINGSMGPVIFQHELDVGLGRWYDQALDGIRLHVEKDHGIGAGDAQHNRLVNDHLAASIRPADKQSLDDAQLVTEILHLPPQP